MSVTKLQMTAASLATVAALITGYEGLTHKAYRDPIGIPTICYGTTRGVKMGDRATQAECDSYLTGDIAIALNTVQSCATVPLNDNQMAAFTSFAYNVGPGKVGVKDGFCVLRNGNKPSFLRALNRGDYTAACNGLLDWTGARSNTGMVTLKGLVKRRQSEAATCLREVNLK